MALNVTLLESKLPSTLVQLPSDLNPGATISIPSVFHVSVPWGAWVLNYELVQIADGVPFSAYGNLPWEALLLIF